MSPKTIYIHGYGVEGQASARHFKHKYPDASLVIIDQSKITTPHRYLNEENALKHFENTHLAKEPILFIRSAGIPPHNKVIAWLDDHEIKHQTALSYWLGHEAPKNTITVTGSKGKSSISSLIAHLLKAKLMGNIGISPFDIKWYTDDIAVIEASSYQLHDLQYPSKFHFISNIYKEHTDWHGSLDLYKDAKYRPFTLGSKGLTEIALQDVIHKLPDLDPALDRKEPFYTNLKTALACIKTTGLCDFEQLLANLPTLLEGYSSLPHRQEIIAVINDITWMDDALATIPEATLLALKGVSPCYPHIHLLIGGKDRGQDYTLFLKDLSRFKNVSLYAFADVKNRLIDQKTIICDDFKDAILKAKRTAQKGDLILFSPAAASEHPFQNYKERATLFKKYAEQEKI